MTGLFREAIRDGVAVVRNYPKRFREKTVAEKLFSAAKLAVFAVSLKMNAVPIVNILPDSPATQVLIRGLGAAALGLAFVAPHLKHNKFINVMQVPIGGLLCAQKVLLGAYGYAVMAAIASARSLTMAVLPDDEKAQRKRYKVALGYTAIGIAGIAMTAVHGSVWNLLPMGAMFMGATASSIISKHTNVARSLYVVGNVINANYSWFYSGSVAATTIDAVGALNQVSAIRNSLKKPAP